MNKKYLLSFIFGAAFTILALYCWKKFSDFELSHGDVYTGCLSDRIHVVANAIQSGIDDNGILPDLNLIRQNASDKSFLKCAGSNREYKFHKDIGKLKLEDNETLLAWCPSGSHKGFSCIIFMKNKTLEAKMVTLSELNKMLEKIAISNLE